VLEAGAVARYLRRFPRGSRRIPKRTSPTMTGSTAMSRSFFLNHSTTPG
jgi:hypothetical protein